MMKKNEKTTYVTWKGIEAAKAEVKQLSEEAVKELKRLESTDEYLELLLESLIYRKK